MIRSSVVWIFVKSRNVCLSDWGQMCSDFDLKTCLSLSRCRRHYDFAKSWLIWSLHRCCHKILQSSFTSSVSIQASSTVSTLKREPRAMVMQPWKMQTEPLHQQIRDSSFNGMPRAFIDRAAGGGSCHRSIRNDRLSKLRLNSWPGSGGLIGPCSCILGATSRMFGGCGPEISVFSPVIAFGCCCVLFDGRFKRASTQWAERCSCKQNFRLCRPQSIRCTNSICRWEMPRAFECDLCWRDFWIWSDRKKGWLFQNA